MLDLVVIDLVVVGSDVIVVVVVVVGLGVASLVGKIGCWGRMICVVEGWQKKGLMGGWKILVVWVKE